MLAGKDVFAAGSQPNQTGDKVSSFAFVIAGCACFLCSLFFITSGQTTAESSCRLKLDERINPNEASAASLERLPGIGTAKAEAIVAYRENFKKETGSNRAFRSCDDLRKVKGIGAGTVEEMSRWLKFE